MAKCLRCGIKFVYVKGNKRIAYKTPYGKYICKRCEKKMKEEDERSDNETKE